MAQPADFKFGDLVRVGLRGAVKWTVVTVGEAGAYVVSDGLAARWVLLTNLRHWGDR